MKSLFEELGGTYTLGEDEMYYPNLTIDDTDLRPIGRWGWMHKAYLEDAHPGLYERLILNGTLYKHLAETNERAETIMELLTEQMKKQEGITEQLKAEQLKAEQPMVWVGWMNNIRSRAEEMVMAEVILSL